MFRGVVPRGAGGVMALTAFGRSVNLMYLNQKGQIMPTTLVRTVTPGFSDLPTTLIFMKHECTYIHATFFNWVKKQKAKITYIRHSQARFLHIFQHLNCQGHTK